MNSKVECNDYITSLKSSDSIVSFKIEDTAFLRIEPLKDFGVIFNSKFSFLHYKRTYKTTVFITKSLNGFQNINTYYRLYYCYVRSILEYIAPIWHPYYAIYKSDIDTMEIS